MTLALLRAVHTCLGLTGTCRAGWCCPQHIPCLAMPPTGNVLCTRPCAERRMHLQVNSTATNPSARWLWTRQTSSSLCAGVPLNTQSCLLHRSLPTTNTAWLSSLLHSRDVATCHSAHGLSLMSLCHLLRSRDQLPWYCPCPDITLSPALSLYPAAWAVAAGRLSPSGGCGSSTSCPTTSTTGVCLGGRRGDLEQKAP